MPPRGAGVTLGGSPARQDARVCLSMREVVARYAGLYSRWTLYEMTRTSTIPHRKLPGRRRLMFLLDELERWEDGAELELVKLAGGGRVVRPVRGLVGH